MEQGKRKTAGTGEYSCYNNRRLISFHPLFGANRHTNVDIDGG
jgi:hypothetical protein